MNALQCEWIQFGQVFWGQSNYFVNLAVWAYKSADINFITIKKDLVDRFRQGWCLFGGVFQGQSNGSDKSIIQLYKSANMKMNFNIMTF